MPELFLVLFNAISCKAFKKLISKKLNLSLINLSVHVSLSQQERNVYQMAKKSFFIIIDDEMPTQPLVTANEADEDDDMDATQPAHVNQAID